MRIEFLRDVMAGSAGVLLVLAVIGLPKDAAAAAPQVPAQWQGSVKLLPYYTSNVHSPVPAPQSRLPGPAHLTP
jgi:hypothetical protein